MELSKEQYIELKNQGYTDKYISKNIMYCSLAHLNRHKKKIGWNFGDGNKFKGRHSCRINIRNIKELRDSNVPNKEIYRSLGVSESTFYRRLKGS